MKPVLLLAPLTLLVACTSSDGGGGDDSGTGNDDTGGGDTGPQPAALTELSSGACPDLTGSGTSTFTSSGEERQVSLAIPASPGENMAVYFFFHGLTDPSYTDNPGGDHIDGLGMQDLADETNSIWIAADAPVQNLYGMFEVYLWDLGLATDHDLVLFDDLRTCVATEFSVDLKRVYALGFSGGALFTTVVAVHRADALAAAVEMSGGSDLEIPGEEDYWSKYATPAMPIPMLISTGGETDVWPDPSLVIVDFEGASDTLQGELLVDGSPVVRCRDERGHTMNQKEWSLATSFAAAHTFGVESPYLSGDLGDDADWCALEPAK